MVTTVTAYGIAPAPTTVESSSLFRDVFAHFNDTMIAAGDANDVLARPTDTADGDRADVLDLAARRPDNGLRLFLPIAFGDAPLPSRIQVLPRPGLYTHKAYGPVVISPERNLRLVEQFNAGLYQIPVPIDLEHMSKLSGAAGWLHRLEMADDGTAYGDVTWTDLGRAVLGGDRFRFVSPEWFPEWFHPATGQRYEDVLVGVALTTRPFFKPEYLKALAATESSGTAAHIDWMICADERERPASHNERTSTVDDVVVTNDAPATETTDTMALSPLAAAETPVTPVEDLAGLRQALQAAEQRANDAASRVEALEKAARTKKFTEMVTAADAPWGGEPDKQLAVLEAITTAYGEDSEIFRVYVAQQSAIAKQLATSEIFTERGAAGARPNGLTAYDEIDAKAQERVRGGSTSYSQAFAEVVAADQSLYKRYLEEKKAGN